MNLINWMGVALQAHNPANEMEIAIQAQRQATIEMWLCISLLTMGIVGLWIWMYDN
jgi:hypothetical protein